MCSSVASPNRYGYLKPVGGHFAREAVRFADASLRLTGARGEIFRATKNFFVRRSSRHDPFRATASIGGDCGGRMRYRPTPTAKGEGRTRRLSDLPGQARREGRAGPGVTPRHPGDGASQSVRPATEWRPRWLPGPAYGSWSPGSAPPPPGQPSPYRHPTEAETGDRPRFPPSGMGHSPRPKRLGPRSCPIVRRFASGV
jgi:hypothetical protein